MFCKNCGSDMAEGTKVCPNCGANMDVEMSATQEQTTAKVKNRDGLAVASLVVSLCGILSPCCSYLGIILGILGIIFGCLSLKSNKRKLAIAGIVIGGIMILFGIGITIFNVVYLMNNPDFMENFTKIFEQASK